MSEEFVNLSENLTENSYELFSVNYSENTFENISYETPVNYPLPPLEAFDSWKQLLLTGLYSFTSLFALIGNIVSIIVLIVGKRSSPELKKYLINLSISDILMALFSIPFTYTDFMLGRWVLPSILCPFAQFITIFSLCASVATLTAIAIERYVAIKHPFSVCSSHNYRSILVMLSIWLLATLLAGPQLFTTNTVPFRYGNNSYKKCREVASRVYSTNYSMILFIITFLLPFFTLLYVYGSIGIKIFRKQIPGLNYHQNHSLINKLKAVKISAVVVMLFIICWLPIQLFNLIIWYNPFLLIRIFNLDMNSYMALFFICHWISSAHSFVNPIIYCFMSANFREDFHNIILRLLPKKDNNSMNNSLSGMTRKISMSIYQTSPNETYV